MGFLTRLGALDDRLLPGLAAAGDDVVLDDQLTDLELHGARDRYRHARIPRSAAEAQVHLAYHQQDRTSFRRRARIMAVFALLAFVPVASVVLAWSSWMLLLLFAVPMLAVPCAVGVATDAGLRRRHATALAVLRATSPSHEG